MTFAQKHAQASKVNVVSIKLTRRKVLQKSIILSSKCRETQRSSMTPQNGFNQGAEQGVHPWPPRRPHCLLPLHPWGRRSRVSGNTHEHCFLGAADVTKAGPWRRSQGGRCQRGRTPEWSTEVPEKAATNWLLTCPEALVLPGGCEALSCTAGAASPLSALSYSGQFQERGAASPLSPNLAFLLATMTYGTKRALWSLPAPGPDLLSGSHALGQRSSHGAKELGGMVAVNHSVKELGGMVTVSGKVSLIKEASEPSPPCSHVEITPL